MSYFQILEFLGCSPPNSILKRMISKRNSVEANSPSSGSVTPVASSPLRKRIADSTDLSPGSLSKLLSERSVRKVCQKVCIEITESFNPTALQRWVSAHKDDEASLASVFNLSARLARHIPDHAEVGAYANSVRAETYREAADGLPRLLLMSVFGDDELARNVEFFLAHLEDSRRPPSESETAISVEDANMLQNIVGKDRGPFLYWLISERNLRFHKIHCFFMAIIIMVIIAIVTIH
jgi:hypothetical protein